MSGEDRIIPWAERIMPTTVSRLARLQVFQPTRAPTFQTREIATPYGGGTITGKLGQQHALLLDAICFHAEKKRVLENGALQLLIDPHNVRRTMSAHSRYSGQGLATLAADLRGAVICVQVPGAGLPTVDGLLDRLVPSPATRINPFTGEARHLYRAEISPTYRAWLERDPILLHYDPSPLARLSYGVTQALARLVLTHRDIPIGGWRLDTLLVGVGIDPRDSVGMRNRRREVRHDAAELAGLGIIVRGDRVGVDLDSGGRVTHARPRVTHARASRIFQESLSGDSWPEAGGLRARRPGNNIPRAASGATRARLRGSRAGVFGPFRPRPPGLPGLVVG